MVIRLANFLTTLLCSDRTRGLLVVEQREANPGGEKFERGDVYCFSYSARSCWWSSSQAEASGVRPSTGTAENRGTRIKAIFLSQRKSYKIFRVVSEGSSSCSFPPQHRARVSPATPCHTLAMLKNASISLARNGVPLLTSNSLILAVSMYPAPLSSIARNAWQTSATRATE